jgi:hypothetical protein
MQRRTFIQLTGAIAMTHSAEAASRPSLYLLTQYFLKNGSQGARLADFLEHGLMEASARLGVPGPLLVLEALVASHMPQVATITPYGSLGELGSTSQKLDADAKFQAALAKWESADEAPYETFRETLLEATSFSPPLAAPSQQPKTPRVFELRCYHSPTEKQLKALLERFGGPEVKIFDRTGIHPVLYSTTLVGPDKPNLVYLTPFDDLAAREKAWAAFGADPEWVKVRTESVARSGQIASVIQISLFKAAAYSPVR